MSNPEQTYRIAAIDLGTVSSRLVLAEVRGGAILSSRKHTEITDLGEGVDATGRFCAAAVERVATACAGFVEEARAFGAERVCTTCTSAARDAENAEDLLGRLRGLGLKPQVIAGTTEARLTFFGVAHDFEGERILVADSGGGSTELASGTYAVEPPAFELDGVRSLDIGCRRVTEKFLASDPATLEQIEAASAWAEEQFAAYWNERAADEGVAADDGDAVDPSAGASFVSVSESNEPVGPVAASSEGVGDDHVASSAAPVASKGNDPVSSDAASAESASASPAAAANSAPATSRPERLVAVGGTVTTLVAMVHELKTYDPAFVHLHDLSLSEVERAIEVMSGLTAERIAGLPGIQPKRARVILAGALVIRALMRTGGYGALTVSENSLLAGMAATINEVLDGQPTTIGWTPELS